MRAEVSENLVINCEAKFYSCSLGRKVEGLHKVRSSLGIRDR